MKTIEELRDENRIEIEQMAEIVNEALNYDSVVAIRKIYSGPDVWIWNEFDEENELICTYTLSRSLKFNGYPLLTMRESVSDKIDSAVTTTSLLIGNEINGVSMRLTILIANHRGAVAGLRSVSRAIVAADGDIFAGISQVHKIYGLDTSYNPKIEMSMISKDSVDEAVNEFMNMGFNKAKKPNESN